MIFKLKANLNELIELLTGLAAASGPKRDLLLRVVPVDSEWVVMIQLPGGDFPKKLNKLVR
jgi:hypothetical protein